MLLVLVPVNIGSAMKEEYYRFDGVLHRALREARQLSGGAVGV